MNTTLLKLCACLVCLSVTVGCASIGGREPGRIHDLYDRLGLDVLVEDASRKTTVIKDSASTERFCRSPNPDFASGQADSISLGLGKGASIGTASSGMIDSLGGRSPALLISRELMYRACELSLNLNADVALSKEIYWRFLATIELAIKNQTGTGVQGTTVTSSTVAPASNAASASGSLGLPTGGDPSAAGAGPPPIGYPGAMPAAAPSSLPR